ncbi:MAG: hypothetical protein ACI9S8_002668 [Chlamydiales bacterium]|jgi:hypothetical protein
MTLDSFVKLLILELVFNHYAKEKAMDNPSSHTEASQEVIASCRKANQEYYHSEAFLKRLAELAKGAKPRIYIEQALWPWRNVTLYLNNCAEAFSLLGCQVLKQYLVKDAEGLENLNNEKKQHFRELAEVDCFHFKPDLIIKNVNNLKEDQVVECPTLMFLDDQQEYKKAAEAFRKKPPGRYDLLYSALGKCSNYLTDILSAQVIDGYLPIEGPLIQDKNSPPEYEIGLAKSLYYKPSFKLRNLLSEFFDQMPEDKKLDALSDVLEKKIFDAVESEQGLNIDWFTEIGKQLGGGYSLANYYQQSFTLKFVEALQKEQFNLALTGANWHLFPHLRKYALGYASQTEDYQSRSLNNKINISINPFMESHPRVFEAGQLGAFFLIYRVPEQNNCKKLPADFKQGQHFDYFSTSQELVEKCRHYLDSPSLRSMIGGNLKGAIATNFSFESYCQKVLTRFKEVIHLGNRRLL